MPRRARPVLEPSPHPFALVDVDGGLYIEDARGNDVAYVVGTVGDGPVLRAAPEFADLLVEALAGHLRRGKAAEEFAARAQRLLEGANWPGRAMC